MLNGANGFSPNLFPEEAMEKRSEPRRIIKTTVICRRYRSEPGTEAMKGTLENCGPEGFCAEFDKPLSKGTILVVQMGGDSLRCSEQDGLRCMGLAEVRWSKPISSEAGERYATGLKYLMTY
jgi:hypothetical protein